MRRILIFLLIACLLTGCRTNSYEPKPEDEIIVTLYPNETNIGTHYFKLQKDGKLTIEIDDIGEKILKEVVLSEEEVSVLYALANEIQSNKHENMPLVDDAMYTKIEYNGLCLEQNFSEMSPSARLLVSELVRIHPVNFGNYVITWELVRKETEK